MDESWQALLSPANRERLDRAIAERIGTKRWFGAKARTIRQVTVVDAFALLDAVQLLLVDISFVDGSSEVYQVPLALASGNLALRAIADDESVWGQLNIDGQPQPMVLVDAMADQACRAALLELFDAGQPSSAANGQVAVVRAAQFDTVRGPRGVMLASQLSQAEQSNTSVRYGDRLILKLYRRIEKGVNPDWELNAFLAARHFARIPPLCGAIEYRQPGQAPWTLALLQGFVKNQGDAWEFALAALREELERFIAKPETADEIPTPVGDLFDAVGQPPPLVVVETFGSTLEWTRRLAQRTSEMHSILASDTKEPAFTPEPITVDEHRAWAHRIGQMAEQTLDLLEGKLATLMPDVAAIAQRILTTRATIGMAIDELTRSPIHATCIRIHGDYHLGQVLVTSDDFVILDFEGEPARRLAERREKQFAIRDVAGMIRSFHYASRTAAAHARQGHPSAAGRIDDWSAAWCFWTSATFLAAYRQTAGAAAFIPASKHEFRRIVNACILEKAIYELRYELNNRPDWVYLPLGALSEILATA